MLEILANWLLRKALKTCPKANKSPNLVTLVGFFIIWNERLIYFSARHAFKIEAENGLASFLRFPN